MTERFTLISELGRGGMGVVWKARDEETGQIVALKLLRDTFADDPSYRGRFEHELAIARRITSPHVVKVLGFGARDGAPYIAFEFVDGPSLRQLLIQHGPYSWNDVRAMLLQIAEGLADAHATGVIHRDVKPSNVMVDRTGTLKLADFGISRALDMTRVTNTTGLLGTPAYLAPEGPVDARSDLYSLGVVAYEMLAGAQPFEGTSYQEVILAHLTKAPDLTRLPNEARPIIAWLLAKNPAARPESARQLIRVLVGGEPVPAVAPAAGPARPIMPAGPGYGGQPPMYAPRTSSISAPAVIGVVVIVAILATVVTVAAIHGGGKTVQAEATPSYTPTPAASSEVAAAVPSPSFEAAPTLSRSSVPKASPGAASGSWAVTDSLPLSSWGQGSALLDDGRFMVIGGSTGAGSSQATSAVWLYDPATGHWTSAASMPEPRAYPMVVRLADGSVLVAGGSADGHPLDTAELYSPDTGSWTATGRMNVPRTEGSLIALPDGRALVAGGGIEGAPNYTATASVEIYDPNSNSWTMTQAMSVARTLMTATLLKDGEVLVAGGSTAYYSAAGQLTSSVQIFDPNSNTWRETSPLPMPLYTHAATLLTNGRVLVTGGYSSSADSAPSLNEAFEFDPATEQWSTVAPLSTARAEHTMLELSDGRVLAMGGVDENYDVLRTVEIYDPAANAWTLTGSLPVAIFWPAAGVLRDGRVLVAGGSTDVKGSGTTARCEVYSPPPR